MVCGVSAEKVAMVSYMHYNAKVILCPIMVCIICYKMLAPHCSNQKATVSHVATHLPTWLTMFTLVYLCFPLFTRF